MEYICGFTGVELSGMLDSDPERYVRVKDQNKLEASRPDLRARLLESDGLLRQAWGELDSAGNYDASRRTLAAARAKSNKPADPEALSKAIAIREELAAEGWDFGAYRQSGELPGSNSKG